MNGLSVTENLIYICIRKFISMNTFIKKLVAVTLLISIVADAWADRGVGKKIK